MSTPMRRTGDDDDEDVAEEGWGFGIEEPAVCEVGEGFCFV